MENQKQDMEIIDNIFNRYAHPEAMIRDYLRGKGRIVSNIWCIEDVTCIMEDMDNAPDLSDDDKLGILEDMARHGIDMNHESIQQMVEDFE